VLLPVRAGLSADFEAAFAHVEPLIRRAHGNVDHTLRRGVERPGTYLLTVGWSTVEDHERGFRGSADYAEWSRLLHRFYDAFPSVLHDGEDLAARPYTPL
jgi:heme-degrading monooxygenase HmoA